jgi:hypothetical protein
MVNLDWKKDSTISLNILLLLPLTHPVMGQPRHWARCYSSQHVLWPWLLQRDTVAVVTVACLGLGI